MISELRLQCIVACESTPRLARDRTMSLRRSGQLWTAPRTRDGLGTVELPPSIFWRSRRFPNAHQSRPTLDTVRIVTSPTYALFTLPL
ncbi:hypothetical protein VTO42DRAFT_6132 [Malbranchea cinnamomea]